MYSGTIPELSDAWYELSGRDKEKHYFRDHLELASREVSKWPEWKQNALSCLLGRVVEVPDEELKEHDLSYEKKLAEKFGITVEEAAQLAAWYD